MNSILSINFIFVYLLASYETSTFLSITDIIAVDMIDGLVTFNRSVDTKGLKIEIFGMEDISGDSEEENLHEIFTQKYDNDENQVILFVESNDAILDLKPDEILERLNERGSKFMISSEALFRHKKSLNLKHGEAYGDDRPIINSGGFVVLTHPTYETVIFINLVNDNLDEYQLFNTFDNILWNKLGIKLNQRLDLFKNQNGSNAEVEMNFTYEEPSDIYQSNDKISSDFKKVRKSMDQKTDVKKLSSEKMEKVKESMDRKTNENRLSLENLEESEFPHVLIGIFILHPTPFLDNFFENIIKLEYPKKRISIFLYNNVPYHSDLVEKFLDKNINNYMNVNVFRFDKHEWEVRNSALDECTKIKCDFYFSLDSDARITNNQTLIRLIEQNKGIIAPLLVVPKKSWSNFWGAIRPDGFYERSDDYMDIVERKIRGIYDVPHISQSYLINSSLLRRKSEKQFSLSFRNSLNPEMDADMSFCKNVRDNHVSMFLINIEEYGYLISSESFNISRKNPEFYEMESNPIDWKNIYIHENYSKVLNDDYEIEQACQDVYWFPLVSPLFCKHLIEICENFGKWIGSEYDEYRDKPGHANNPTRDILMKQVGLEEGWLFFLTEYVRPVQLKAFLGYDSYPLRTFRNFVIRYNPAEISAVYPHFDVSTYTINLALNRPRIDYEGGGCYFIRQNCSVTELRLGWALMHPGRLTHLHEGIPTTNGTRYLMVSFVDP